MERFVLRPGVDLIEADGELALIYSYGRHLFVRTELAEIIGELFSELRNATSREGIFARFNRVPPQQLMALIDKLLSERLIQIIQAPESTQAHESEGWNIWGGYLSVFSTDLTPSAHTSKFAPTEIGHLSLNGMTIDSSRYGEALSFLSVRTLSLNGEISPFPLVLVSASWFDHKAILDINKRLYNAKQPWLLILEDGLGGAIGPIFNVQGAPCFECMWRRKMSFAITPEGGQMLHRGYHSASAKRGQISNPLAREIIAGLTLQQTVHFLWGLPNTDLNKCSIDIDLLNLRTQRNEVFPLPYCDICSEFTSQGLENTLSAPD